MAVGIIVALLRAATLIAGEQHGHALAEKERGQYVANLSGAKRLDIRSLCGAFHTVIIREVVVVAVAVALAVSLVVLLAKADQVAERKAVMRCDKIDAVVGLSAVVSVQVAGTRKTRSEMARLGVVAPPIPSHIVAVASVPLGPPQAGKRTNLVGTCGVPRFGDDLRVG